AENTGLLRENFDATAQHAVASIGYQANDVSGRFAETANEAISAIATHGDRINEALASRLEMFENAMNGQGGAMADSIGERAERLAASLTERLGAIENVLTLQGGALDEKLGQRADEATA